MFQKNIANEAFKRGAVLPAVIILIMSILLFSCSSPLKNVGGSSTQESSIFAGADEAHVNFTVKDGAYRNDLTNIAVGKAVSCSSEYSLNTGKDNAADGNLNTAWLSEFTGNNEWIYIDLGALTTINGLGLRWHRENFAKNFKILYAVDGPTGKVWTEAYEETAGIGGTRVYRGMITCRYIGVQCIDTGINGYGLSEMEVYQRTENLLVNGNFSAGLSGWSTLIDTSGSPAASGYMLITNKMEAKTSIKTDGTESWQFCLEQLNVTLNHNDTYQLSFDIRAESDRSADIFVGMSTAPYTDYYTNTIDVTTTTQNIVRSFTMSQSTNPRAKVAFNLGSYGTADVYIDNVELINISNPTQPAPTPLYDSGKELRTGLRISQPGLTTPYPAGVNIDFPSEDWVYNAVDEMTYTQIDSYQSRPTVMWIIGNIIYHDAQGQTIDPPYSCKLYFNGSTTQSNITFASGYPTAGTPTAAEVYFDKLIAEYATRGVKPGIWLQLEPGDADVTELIRLVLDEYHTKYQDYIVGIGVDGEWIEWNYSTLEEGREITSTDIDAWFNKIDEYSTEYKLFLKHWLVKDHMPYITENSDGSVTANIPVQYQDRLVFINDAKDKMAGSTLHYEFLNWANLFHQTEVGFQFGYDGDLDTWMNVDLGGNVSMAPQAYGEYLIKTIENAKDIYWVDFTAKKLWPVTTN